MTHMQEMEIEAQAHEAHERGEMEGQKDYDELRLMGTEVILNMTGPKRTWQQVKIKYKNILQNAMKKNTHSKGTGGGSPKADLTPAEDLALEHNNGRPVLEGIPWGKETGIGPSQDATHFIQAALVLRRAFRRERVFRDRLDPLAFPDDHLYERYRFSADGNRYLCRLLGPRIKHRTAWSHALCVEQMVCVALRFFASGAFLYSVGDAEQLNKATICCTIRSVCLAINALAEVFISFPGHRRLCDIKEEFYRIAGFPNVIGAVDCTHIRIEAPSGAHEADFVNRKSFHSINVQMVCNADCVISNVVAKWPGSVHDSRIFRASEIYQRLSQGEPHSPY
nr:putative nuclease HARBI1 [Misgurnus anguillicaudatus]